VVVVTSGDIPLLDADTVAALTATHAAEPAAVTVLTTTLPDSTGYGRILRTQDGEVIAIVEESDATPQQQAIREVNSGVYAFDIDALRAALNELSSDNAQHELYLTDVIAILRRHGHVVHAKHVDDSTRVAGVNDRVQLAALAAELNRRVVARHQRAGVTIVDPASTWIDVDVTVGGDTVIHPGTQLLGATTVGGHCTIGPDTTLADVTVGDRPGRGGGSVHLPEARHPARGRWEARCVRRGQELGDRHGNKGAAPDLRRGCRHRRTQQHRRVKRLRELRRRDEAPHHRGLARAYRLGHHVRRARAGR
jgi:NDP-sugar pyrophosphorylase family protein